MARQTLHLFMLLTLSHVNNNKGGSGEVLKQPTPEHPKRASCSTSPHLLATVDAALLLRLHALHLGRALHVQALPYAVALAVVLPPLLAHFGVLLVHLGLIVAHGVDGHLAKLGVEWHALEDAALVCLAGSAVLAFTLHWRCSHSGQI